MSIGRSQTDLLNMFLMLPVILVYTKDQINKRKLHNGELLGCDGDKTQAGGWVG